MLATFRPCTWIVWLLTVSWITCTNGSSVNLTIEGGVSLVGPHCPGTGRLFCEGIDLSFLRWRYNGGRNIISYFSNGESSTQPVDTAYFDVQLQAVNQNPSNPSLANFSSFLTVNLSRLQTNAISDISCGDPGVAQAVPVNVTIVEPGVPSNPTITMVTAAYESSGELNSIVVTWMQSSNYCLGLLFMYEVNITTYDSVVVSCGDVTCTSIFHNLTRTTDEFVVSIRAENELGASDTVIYPVVIAQVQQYFRFEVYFRNKQIFGLCTATEGSFEYTGCTVQYTTDFMYRNLSSGITAGVGTEFLILNSPSEVEKIYLSFLVLLSGTLEITERITFNIPAEDTVPGWGIALIVIVVIIVCLCVVTMVMTAIRLHLKSKTIKEDTEQSLPEEHKDYKPLRVILKSADVRRTHSAPTHAYYQIETQFRGQNYAISRQFSDFEELYMDLKKIPHLQLGDLRVPSEEREQMRLSKYRKDLVEEYKFGGLQKFLNNLLEIEDILEQQCVQKFLDISSKLGHDATLYLKGKKNDAAAAYNSPKNSADPDVTSL